MLSCLPTGLKDAVAKSHSRRGRTVTYRLCFLPNPLQTHLFPFSWNMTLFFPALTSGIPELCCLVFAAHPQPLSLWGVCRTPAFPVLVLWEVTSWLEHLRDKGCLSCWLQTPSPRSWLCGVSPAQAGPQCLEGWLQEGHCALGDTQPCCGCSAASWLCELLQLSCSPSLLELL